MRGHGVLCLILMCSAAYAADDDQARYSQCVQQSTRNPQAALAIANSWKPGEGGMAAAHCMALALVGLKRYKEAATKLDVLAHRPDVASIALRSEILSQAGNAWLLAGDAKSADASFASALTLNPRDPDTFADVARAKAALQDWVGAESHLTAALKISPQRADLLILRASARHALGHTVEARADLERALDIRPGMPEALLERGSLKQEGGDIAGARADWEAALSLTSDPDLAGDARKLLNGLP